MERYLWRAYIIYCLKVISYCTVSVQIFKLLNFRYILLPTLLENGTYMENVIIPSLLL